MKTTVYHRCDACDFVFRPRDEPEEAPVRSQPTLACLKCGSHRTRIVGQSGIPPVIHRRCEACGDLWSNRLDSEDPSR